MYVKCPNKKLKRIYQFQDLVVVGGGREGAHVKLTCASMKKTTGSVYVYLFLDLRANCYSEYRLDIFTNSYKLNGRDWMEMGLDFSGSSCVSIANKVQEFEGTFPDRDSMVGGFWFTIGLSLILTSKKGKIKINFIYRNGWVFVGEFWVKNLNFKGTRVS